MAVRRRSRDERTVRETRVCVGGQRARRARRVVCGGGVRWRRRRVWVCRRAHQGISKRLRAWIGRRRKREEWEGMVEGEAGAVGVVGLGTLDAGCKVDMRLLMWLLPVRKSGVVW